jgi:RNA polymerase primary sigma factor
LTDLAKAVHRWDVRRHGMQLALAWVESRRPYVGIRSDASTEALVAYQQAVRRVHGAQARAKQRFASANLRLVMMIAGQHNHRGLPLSDLIQEGNVGLMTAVERFDPSRGLRFSTYASFWIRHMIRRALMDKSRTVRAPGHRQQQARELARALSRILACTGSLPTTDELAKELRWPERRVLDFEERPTVMVWSLDRPMSERQGDGTFLDSLADHAATPTDEAMATLHWTRELVKLLDELRPIEAHILRCRFGLDGIDETTFQSLADELNLSRERVRQLQQAALQRLRRRIEAQAENPREGPNNAWG